MSSSTVTDAMSASLAARTRASSVSSSLTRAAQAAHLGDEPRVGADADVTEQGLGHDEILHAEGVRLGLGPRQTGHRSGEPRVPPQAGSGQGSGHDRVTPSGASRAQRSTKPVSPPRGGAPALGDEVDPARACPGRAAARAARSHASSRALGDDLDPAVGEVGRLPTQPELERPRPGPPAEADALHAALDEGGEAHVAGTAGERHVRARLDGGAPRLPLPPALRLAAPTAGVVRRPAAVRLHAAAARSGCAPSRGRRGRPTAAGRRGVREELQRRTSDAQ